MKLRWRGFTVLELLVVLAVVGVLVACLLPAVQQAREAARRSVCLTRLKQIGLALEGYHDAHRQFPSGRGPASAMTGSPGRSAFVAILPFIEQTGVYDAINFDRPQWWVENSTASAHRSAVYACPSDPGADLPAGFGPGASPPFQGTVLTSYGFVFGAYPLQDQYDVRHGQGLDLWTDPRGQQTGCFNDLQSIRKADVLDGLSYTAMASERNLWRANVAGRLRYPVGIWISTVTANTLLSFDFRPNLDESVPLETLALRWSRSPSSAHPGGVNVLFGDGSVRFIQDQIDCWAAGLSPEGFWLLGPKDLDGYYIAPPDTSHLWQSMATRAKGDATGSMDY